MKLFSSDIHESHNNICKLTNRKDVVNQEHHTEWLIEMWNNNVTNNDQIFHCGDYSFSAKYDHIAKFTSKLKGQKFFIKGNHDRSEFLNQLVKDRLIQAWYDYKEIKINDSKICLFHYPLTTWNRSQHGSIMLHGHCHGSLKLNQGKILDVGIDSAYNILGQHRFFTEDDIADYMSKRDIHTVDHHTVKDNDEKY